ncbi:SCAN domain-containing protein 3-like [Artemia franciscana]|uniref:SCAN domain-containing protein 3-like n=1 Tax=Artemia franciscana TaxID=6661 RepID=UPI0032D9AF5C
MNRHLSTVHPSHVGKPMEFFKRKQEAFASNCLEIAKVASVSSKALRASYAVSYLVAKQKKPHTIAEYLILQALVKASAHDTGRIKKYQILRCSGRRNKGQLKEEQLTILLRCFDEEKIKERPIGCYHIKSLDAESLATFTDDTVTRIGLDWDYCVAECYNGARVMSGPFSGVQAPLRVKSPQQLQAVDLAISRSCTLIQTTRSELTDLDLDASFVSLFEKAKEFATELEIKVPAVNELVTRPSSVGQKGRPRIIQKITKHLKQFVTTSTLGKDFIKSGNRTTNLGDEMKRA